MISLQEWSPYRPPEWIGFDNYQEMLFEDPIFWQAFANTLWFMASSLVAIAIALGLALLVNTDIRGREVYRTIIFLSYPLMTVAVAIIWRWMYDERVGFFNYVLRGLGIIDQPIPFLQSFAWSLPCAIVANIWQILGFYMIILLTGLAEHPAKPLRGGGDRRCGRAPSLLAHHPADAAAVIVPVHRRRHAQLDHQLRSGLRDDQWRSRSRHRALDHLYLQARFCRDAGSTWPLQSRSSCLCC